MPIIPFEAETVPLQQSNLIEASAGTGKTYSIAILCLRLLLEKNIALPEILMVTFTKAAVAELETRIRAFVLMAHQASIGQKSNDDKIDRIVRNCQQQLGEAETELRLKNALLFLDETAILTIHGFCQRTLSEFAFETNQIFGAEAMSETDLKDLMEDEINEFWRKHIVVLELALLRYLNPEYLTRELLSSYLDNAIAGKKLLAIADLEDNLLSPENQQRIIGQLDVQQEIIDEATKAAIEYLIENEESLARAANANKNAIKKFIPLFGNWEALLEEILKSVGTNYVQNIFGEVIVIAAPIFEAKNEMDTCLQRFSNQLYQMAIASVIAKVKAYKEQKSLLAFDDMITKLHDAVVVRKNPSLIAALQLKYKAVFIDEFQDTDKLQYEIFNGLFAADNILFYIGDPKQSIYAWRKADILTYFKAANEVANIYGMNTNYRSCNGIIEAQNVFFKPEKDYDTFHFLDAVDAIQYIKVAAPTNNDKGNVVHMGKPVTPMSIYENEKEEAIENSVFATVAQLLSDPNFMISDKKGARRITPSDIGILVRANKKGQKIKELLAAHKIPAVTIDESKISDTAEAIELLYVLQAVNDIRVSTINKALLSGLTGYDIKDILQLNEEMVLNQFKRYQQVWARQGVYVMLMQFVTDYKIKTHLLDGEKKGGERRLSNVLQLIEVLHKNQISNQYAPIELLNWLQKLTESKTTVGDEFEQRIESDSDSVKIVTIHKSKGLEYNIVIAPYLDFTTGDHDFCSFRNDDTGEYLFAGKEILSKEQSDLMNKQLEQENRRLMYVAITRAKYKCYLHRNVKKKGSSLKNFIDAIKKAAPETIAFDEVPEIPSNYRYNSDTKAFPISFRKAKDFSLESLYWRKLSYTFLNPEHASITKTNAGEPLDEYSDFVFRRLKKGAYTGNLLHYIFEFMDFSDASYWPKVIETALKRLSPGNTETYTELLLLLLQQVTQATISCNDHSFQLAQISSGQCLNEFEFDFSVSSFQAQEISELSTPSVPLHIRSFDKMEGMMNGKMDLFFEQNGRYYILDWKSNYLGDQLSDYNTENVWEAMAQNNYHLQYHIYTVAICKYLSLRIPNFSYDTHFGGVIYLFVRGVRMEGNTGIFFSKPDNDVIAKMTQRLTAGEGVV
jgi:exodeoxyribonuclease V beta subunit